MTRLLAWMENSPGRVLLIMAALLLIQVSTLWYPTFDGALYLSTARSYVTGEPGIGVRQGIPPVYPLLLSPAFLLSERPILLVSVLQCVFAVCAMVGVYYWARRVYPAAAVLVTGVSIFNATVLLLYRRTLKEMAFMAVVVWTANLMHLVLSRRGGIRVPALGLAVGAGLAAGILIRYATLALWCGFAVAIAWQVVRKRMTWGTAVILLLTSTIPPAVAVVAHARHQQAMAAQFHRGSYAGAAADAIQDHQLAERIWAGLTRRIADSGRITLPGMFKVHANSSNLYLALYTVWFVLLCCGWGKLLRGGCDPLLLAMPFYVGIYVLWPVDQGARFLAPMSPVLMAAALTAVVGVASWIENRKHPGFSSAGAFPRTAALPLTIGFLAHPLIGLGYWAAIDAPRAARQAALWTDIDAVARQLPPKSFETVLADIPVEQASMLQLAADRPVDILAASHRPIPAAIRWFVNHDANERITGFEKVWSGDHLVLFRRDASAPPSIGRSVNDVRRGEDEVAAADKRR